MGGGKRGGEREGEKGEGRREERGGRRVRVERIKVSMFVCYS